MQGAQFSMFQCFYYINCFVSFNNWLLFYFQTKKNGFRKQCKIPCTTGTTHLNRSVKSFRHNLRILSTLFPNMTEIFMSLLISLQTGFLDKVVNKLEKAGDVIQGGLEAAGHFLESEWNKHKFGLILVGLHFHWMIIVYVVILFDKWEL